MKRRHVIAIGIGALISAIFLTVPEDWLSPGMREWGQLLASPGHIAMMLVWGAHGPVSSENLALAFAWGVNAAVYSLVAFATLSVFRISN